MIHDLLEIEDAWRLVFDAVESNTAEKVSLGQAVARTLADPVLSDLDSPPFHKSLVDGYAIARFESSEQIYEIVETVTAGHVPRNTIAGDQATRIMTGCPIPDGALGVVMVEETEEISKDRIRVRSTEIRPGQNILQQGAVIGKDQPLMASGHVIRPHDIGALAEFGRTELKVFRRSKVSVLTTGDELVNPDQQPGPGQIRNSNASLLMALARATGAAVTDLGIGRDSLESLQPRIRQGLDGDVLVIAGGVSAGRLDLIPQCLEGNRVEKIFHKINLKPGKPLWFGKAPNGCLVFGLPGNPVSSLVCFKLFAEPAIRKQFQPEHNGLKIESAVLAKDFKAHGGRRTFWPIRLDLNDSRTNDTIRDTTKLSDEVMGNSWATPLPWKGSADQVTFLKANGLMDLGQRTGTLQAGTRVRVIRF